MKQTQQQDNNDFDFDVGEFEPSQNKSFSADEKQKLEREILYCVQGVGSIKSVGGVDVYVKSDSCEDSIRELIKHLKFDQTR